MRAIWKGHIRFSLVTIPVRIYNALDSAQAISFNLLTREGHHPVAYEKKDKVTGKVLRNEDIVKGYQYEPGQYVIIEQEDLDKIKLKSTRIIEIEGFVQANEVHPTLYETPYFIGPDGEVAAKTYALLTAALKETGKVGVGRVVLRDRETPVLLNPHEGGILMYKLRYPDELRSIREVPQLIEAKADKEQLKLAKSLIDSMSVKFSSIKLEDHYLVELKKLIKAKIEGREIVSVEEPEPEVVDIMTALKESIARAKQKPMEKAKGKTAEKVSSKTLRRKAG
ncbi:MAG: Ku protein [Cyclobacteriaceae bacterium]|nr:Ku protein [Cyclobacteriaceae bacterium]MCX7636289.1 Ku protein [Cyclobacteriaceae bacterium]MDW8330867.1 Ku protein [Cyclobacteriaceae bacterium]